MDHCRVSGYDTTFVNCPRAIWYPARSHWTGGCDPFSWHTGDYCTYTQGGWGATPAGNNPGAILASNFSTVYRTGVVAGGSYSMTFTSASAIDAYLPAGGTPGPLTGCSINPTSTSSGVFGGQVLTLRLNVDFNTAGILASTLNHFSSVVFSATGDSLNGKSIAQIWSAAQTALGGGALPSGYTYSTFNTLIDSLNTAFDNCVLSDWAQTHLSPGE